MFQVVSTVDQGINVTEGVNSSVNFCINATLPDFGLNETLMVFIFIGAENSALRKFTQ